jgi:signal transduction histidine kinase
MDGAGTVSDSAAVSDSVAPGDAVTLQRITQFAADLVGARYAALGVIDGDGRLLSEFHVIGLDPEQQRHVGDPPHGGGILGLIIREAVPLRLHDLTQHPASVGFPPDHPPMGTFLGVPIRVHGTVFGNLYLTEKYDGEDFTQRDEDVVVALAAAAGVAIENVRLLAEVRRASADRQRLAIFEDRDRIAQDLHDIVIQRLFAVGLGIQALQARTTAQGLGPDVTGRLSEFIDEIDLTMAEIRRVIFALQDVPALSRSLVSAIGTVVTESRQIIGFAPGLSIEGPVDTLVPEAARADLVAVLREGLTNVARHAQARRVQVRAVADVAGGRFRLTIEDDGVGVARTSTPGHGTVNMAARAQRFGGSSRLDPRTGGGAALVWEIPLSNG